MELFAFLLAALTTVHCAWEAPEDHPVHEFLEFLGSDEVVREALVARLPDRVRDYVEAAAARRRDPELFPVVCAGCLSLADALNGFAADNVDWEDLRDDMVSFCELLLGILDDRTTIICPGIADLQIRHVYRIFRERTVTSEEACLTLNFCLESHINPPPLNRKVLRTVERPLVRRKATRRDIPENALKFVQLTDIHVDPEYAAGAPTDCGLPICCRNYWEGEGSAGPWGTYGCGTSVKIINQFLQQIKDLNPDVIFFSGDNPPHSLWNETLESQLRHSRTVVNLVTSQLSGIPTYGSIGNHELFPTNLYYMSMAESQSFNEAFYNMWRVPAGLTDQQMETINRGGYYSKVIRPGLRLIVYNSDFGYNMNWYVIWSKDETEYLNMKRWVSDQLMEARRNNEKVILMGHHPTGSSTIHDFSSWLYNTVMMYHQEIVLNLFGHTHTDRFLLSRTPGAGRALNVQFVAPSFTTYPFNNPSARVFYLDPNTFQLLDYEQYFMNLTAANEAGPDANPRVEMTYRATTEYGLPDMSPASWQALVQRFETDDALFQRWYNHQRGHPSEPGTCEEDCKHNALCGMREVIYENYRACTDQETPP